MKLISGWGCNPNVFCNVKYPKNLNSLKRLIDKKCIARGNGRSYGDSSLQPNLTIDMKNFNKFYYFDDINGLVKVQSGLILNDLLKIIVPKGWFVPVSPGTKFVTIGGMVASNVHGKNHHKVGGFINYVKSLTIINEHKKIITCSEKNNKILFKSTFGGMGLTGVIIDITFKLKKILNKQSIKSIISNQKNFVVRMDLPGKYKNKHKSIILLEQYNNSKNKVLALHQLENSLRNKRLFSK